MSDVTVKEDGIDLMEDILPIAVSERTFPVDILDRQEIVKQLLDLLTTLSEAQSSCTFALNGKWGSGKTFLLNMLESQLRDYQAGERFMVFHYNCWQYDYYDEPLTAIVSAMLDNADENTYFFSGKVRKKARSGINAAKTVLREIGRSLIENKIGIDVNDLSETMDAEKQHEYDKYYAFHRVIENARKKLSKLTKGQTLVIVVDELDRCLPNYAIKTLERLHHLFSGLTNTILIMALDKTQLDHTIKMIFGEETDCDAYLKKFIDFEFEIDFGTVNDSFLKKYGDYIALFDESALEPWAELPHYISALFSEMEIRRQEHLVKKLSTIHRLLFNPDEKKDYSFLCFELLMAVVSEKAKAGTIKTAPLYYKDTKGIAHKYSEYQLMIECSIPAPLITYVKEHWTYQIGVEQTPHGMYPFCSEKLDIPLLLIGYSELTYGEEGILSRHPERSKYDGYIRDFKAVKRMLEIIK